MVCYDYRTIGMTADLLSSYRQIYVAGWSMGVWAASHLLSRLSLPLSGSIAINGTPFPIDDTRGIPQAIYQGTLEGLTERSLHKFLRRMCADTAAFHRFLRVTPRRPLEELREELVCIADAWAASQAPPTFHWQQAVAGSNDRIIPPANQLQAWQQLGTPVIQNQDAHYPEETFNYYLQEQWTKD